MAATTATRTISTDNNRIDYTRALPQRTKLLILGAVMLSLFLAALDQTIVATALPAIVREFRGIDLVSWVSTGYLLASTATVPIYGKLSDIYGRKPILLWGISVFLVGSILCGISGSMLQLILYRVIQGVGAAAITSTAFATPADLFVSAERAKYMGLFGSVFGLASIIGPFIGGLLTDQFSWHWIFYVNIPLGLLALAFVMAKMPSFASGSRPKIDWLGTILLIGAVVPFMLGLTLDKSIHSWSSPLNIGLFTTALICTTLFLIVEFRAESPVITLSLFHNRTFVIGVIASMLSGAALFGAVLFLSLFLVNVLGFTATEAGITQIPLMIGFVLGSNGSSLIVQRSGRYKPLIVAGFVIMIIGFFLMSRVSIDSSGFDIVWRIFLVGLGLGPALPLLNLAMQNAVPSTEIGAATANRQFFQQLGQAIGGAVFGVVLTTSLTVHLQQNFTPITQDLPPATQAALDPAHFRNSAGGGEGGGDRQVDLEGQVTAALVAPIEQQRQLAQAALGEGDATARTELLNSPETLPEIKAQVQQSVGADSQGLAQANKALAEAEQQLQQAAPSLSQRLGDAVRLAYAVSITRIYVYALWLAILALAVLVLWLPEIPLAKHSPAEMPPVVE